MIDFDKCVSHEECILDKWNENIRQKGIIPLSIADMDFKCAPEIINALSKTVEAGLYGYSYRSDPYFSSIINWAKNRHDLTIQKEQIIPSFGVVPAINAAICALSKENDGVIVNIPAYYPFFSSVTHNKRKLLESKLVLNENGSFEIDFADLECKIKTAKLYLFNSPHNPSGRVWSLDELIKIAKLCKKYGVAVISDEIHNDLIVSAKKHISFMKIANKYDVDTVVCLSASKTFNMAGLNTSYCFASNSKIKSAVENELYRTGFYHNNLFGMAATQCAYDNCGYWLDELKIYLRKNLDIVCERLSKFKDKVEVIRPEGTYLMLLKFTDFSAEYAVKTLRQQYSILVENGDDFKCNKGFVRLNMACTKQTLSEALNRIEIFLTAQK